MINTITLFDKSKNHPRTNAQKYITESKYELEAFKSTVVYDEYFLPFIVTKNDEVVACDGYFYVRRTK